MDINMEVAGLPPISKEQAFLETYFQCLNSFAHEKAKEKADKEKESQKACPVSPIWVSMIACLGTLAVAEKEYNSLAFLNYHLSHKLLVFGRKDTLRQTYTFLQQEFKRIEDVAIKTSNNHGQSASTLNQGNLSLDHLLGHLSGQLSHYITARIKTMEFFEQLSTLSQYRNMNYDDLLVVITDIIQAHQKDFHHPILSPLKTNFTLECDIISHLIQSQLQIQHCQFLPALLLLNEAHTKLTTWGSVISQKETKSGLFGGSNKHPPVPVLYQWLMKFKGILVSKFTLYFFDVLSKQGPSTELKNFTSKASVDFIGKIIQFHRKCDAHCTCLVYDTQNLEDKYPYKGPGYHHPSKPAPQLMGLESYPAVFTYPGERADKHWPGVISIMTDRIVELNTMEKITCFCDEKIQSTYFMTRVEPRMTFVVIFECKKSEKDSYVINFINDICSSLRFTKLFNSLKSGSKSGSK